MAKYERILVALDFYDDNSPVIDKGRKVAADNDAALYLIHVIEPFTVAYALDSLGPSEQLVEIELRIKKDAQHKMDEVSGSLDVPEERTQICSGNPANEIHEFAQHQDIDLIVMGTHGQSGLQLLLGSTANSVLHGVSCDVLAVRIN